MADIKVHPSTPTEQPNLDIPTIDSDPKLADQTEIERRKKLSPTARRALEEADARRAARQSKKLPKEINGQAGPEPTRYGDWEKKGVISDF